MPKPVATDEPQHRGAAKLIAFPEVRLALAAAVDYGFRKSRLVGISIILLLIVMIAAAWWLFSSSATFRYTTMPVTRGAVIHMVTGSGTVNPQLAIIVGTYVSGVIQELYCDYNTVVKKGQICAKIDPRPFQTIVDQSKANILAAKAQQEKDKASLTYAKLNLDRAAQLARTNAVSQDTFDIAKSTYEQAQTQIALDEAAIEQRQAELASAQVNLDYTNIISPVDGVVVSRNVTMGETVAATYQTPTLFLIATDLTKMEVDTNVSESDIAGLKEGNNATFTVDAFPKRTFRGVVSQVRQSPQTVQNVVTYDVVISVSNQDLALMPGMTADAKIVTDQRDNVIRVPNAALHYMPSGTRNKTAVAQVWILHNNQPTAIPVELGLDDDSFTQIVGGDVKPGDRVITAEQ
jgi:HlyD family secretion protein